MKEWMYTTGELIPDKKSMNKNKSKHNFKEQKYLTHEQALTRRKELKLIAQEFRAMYDDRDKMHLKKIALCFDKLSTL